MTRVNQARTFYRRIVTQPKPSWSRQECAQLPPPPCPPPLSKPSILSERRSSPCSLPFSARTDFRLILGLENAVPAALFQEAEAAEFQRRDFFGAARRYRRVAESPNPAIRAEALVRLGRILRRQNNRAGALRVYAELQQLGSVSVGGQPVGMIARQVRYRLSEMPGERDAFRQALYSGATKMDRATFEFYRDMLREWGGPAPPPSEVARTEAAIALWKRWKLGDIPARGREVTDHAGLRTLAVWASGPDHPSVRLVTFPELETTLGSLGEARGSRSPSRTVLKAREQSC